MTPTVIQKTGPFAVSPNMPDYATAVRRFDWASARAELGGSPSTGLNIAHEAVDRHVAAGRGGHEAVRFIGRDGDVRRLSYAELLADSARFADVLATLGVGRGDRVFTLLGHCPELFATVLGTLRNGSVLCPLFSAFGPDPVCERLRLGDARVLVTTASLYARKVAGRRRELPNLETVVVLGSASHDGGVLSYDTLMRDARPGAAVDATGPEDMALLHFTSGTTGAPKGAVHVHDAVVAHHATGFSALDLHDDDVFWCTADPGWVTGTSYGIIAPLTHGVTTIVDEGE
ncbi:MAG TPA: AMP-binding protein, partial [Yinghuangia sp.]|nr:AMP-binding protein [Yinghuangia sp.]